MCSSDDIPYGVILPDGIAQNPTNTNADTGDKTMNPETETLDEKAVGPALEVQHRSVALVSDTFVPHNLVELKELASFLAASDLIPKSLGGRKENVAIVLMLGHEIGVPGVAALQNIFVVNNRPSIYGDLATALVRRSGLVEKLSYTFEGAGPSLKCIAVGQRKGDKEAHTVVYTWADAVLAGHTNKDTYIKNPKDMIMWKTLHRLFKFLWPDVLKGLMIREIAAEEIQEAEVVPQVELENPAQATSAPAQPPTAGPEPAKRKAGRPKANPDPAPATPPEPTPEEIAAKVEAAKARYNAAGTAPATETLADEPKKDDYQDNGFAEGKKAPTNSVKGIITRALRLSDPATKDPIGFGIGIEVKEGKNEKLVEHVYMVESQDYAMAMRPLATDKTLVELFVEPLETPIPGVKGKAFKYEVVK